MLKVQSMIYREMWYMMITQKTLLPGQPGSKKWVEKYGRRLVCVRYKYDAQTREKMITVELVEQKKKWRKNKKRIPGNKIVFLRVNYGEVDLGIKIRSFGGQWDRKKKVWKLAYKAVKALRLENRIISEEE